MTPKAIEARGGDGRFGEQQRGHNSGHRGCPQQKTDICAGRDSSACARRRRLSINSAGGGVIRHERTLSFGHGSPSSPETAVTRLFLRAPSTLRRPRSAIAPGGRRAPHFPSTMEQFRRGHARAHRDLLGVERRRVRWYVIHVDVGDGDSVYSLRSRSITVRLVIRRAQVLKLGWSVAQLRIPHATYPDILKMLEPTRRRRRVAE